jgi:20S proteasome alpha/beta subunit
VIEDVFRILFYRDKKAADEIQFCKITKANGVEIEKPYRFQSNWDSAFYKEKTNEFWRPMRLQEKEVKYI